MINEEEQDNMNHLSQLGQTIGISTHPDDEDAPLPERATPGWVRFMPAVIRESWSQGVTFNMDNASGDIFVEGFYKYGPLRLVITDQDGVVAHEQNDNKTPILSFSDLVNINFRYWMRVNRPKGTYIHPERPWLDAFKARNLVTRSVIYLPKEDKTEDSI